MLVFEERGKPEYPEKNLSEQGREPTTNSTRIWRRVRESNPGHIGGRPVLSPLRYSHHYAIPAPLELIKDCNVNVSINNIPIIVGVRLAQRKTLIPVSSPKVNSCWTELTIRKFSALYVLRSQPLTLIVRPSFQSVSTWLRGFFAGFPPFLK